MRTIGLLLAVASGVATFAAAARASACGGTFCDAGPMTSVVDQAAETVLFVRDAGFVEAHVQIAIDPSTDAQKFAWIVPMPAAPEFSIGSQPLFDALLAGTSPSYALRGDNCSLDPTGVGFIQNPDGGGASRDPDVHTQTVGAFEVTTLDGGTVDAVMTWLGDNGYAQDPAAEPILAEYLAQDFVLVALRLTPEAGVGDVHPIVLRYAGTEPCVPLRLTAIAAAEDMGVRTFFLDEQRWAPTNYRHVVLNPLHIRWGGGGYDYPAAVTIAVDEAPAGHGFVTEYAGASDIVSADSIYAANWDAAPFVDAEPTTVVELLNGQGLADCTKLGLCIVPYPLVVAMLRTYLPAPEGVNENDFYRCLSCYADMTDFAAWDGPAFAAELEERVIAPGARAAELLASWSYVTRMYTTISPHEMTEDPEFHVAPDLPDVPLEMAAVAVCLECEGDALATLPDGREVYLEGSVWPAFNPAMPWAERIEQIPENGAPIVELDNRATIDAMLADYNAEYECGPSGSGSASGTEGGGTQGGPLDGGFPGSSESTGGPTAGASEGVSDRGCACGAQPPPGRGWLLVALAGLWARRRRT